MNEGLLLCGLLLSLTALVAFALRALIHAVPIVHAWNPESHDKMTSYAIELLKQDRRPTLFGWFLKEHEHDRFLKENLILQIRRGSVDEDMNSDLWVSLEPMGEMLKNNISDSRNLVELYNDLSSRYPHTGLLGYGKAGDAAAAGVGIGAGIIITSGVPGLIFKGLLGPVSAMVLINGYRKSSNFHIAEWLARGIDFFIKLAGKDLDGTNGGYHFYNPSTGVGLSDPVSVAVILKKMSEAGILRKFDIPMNSAYFRATEAKSPKGWWMDREERSYTIGDSVRYYEQGYHHLSAYAIGRVTHLLQDMAVPAHVRDDAHFGIEATDPADVLEYYAAEQDWVLHFHETSTSVSKRWAFQRDRVWNSSKQPNFLTKAAALYEIQENEFLKKESISCKTFFDTLAWQTYSGHYSLGTIPGNADSHNPDDTTNSEGRQKIPWVPDQPPDFTRCQASVEALFEVFDILRLNVQTIIWGAVGMRNIGHQFSGVEQVQEPLRKGTKTRERRAREFASSTPSPSPHSQIRRGAPVYKPRSLTSEEGRKSIDKWLEKYKILIPDHDSLVGLVKGFQEGKSGEPAETIRKGIDIIMNLSEALESISHLPLSPYLDGREGDLKPEDIKLISKMKKYNDALIATFQKRCQGLDGVLLKKCLTTPPLSAGLEKWIAGHPYRKGLADAYAGVHGPCCIANLTESPKTKEDLKILTPQYLECESQAIAYSALLMAWWFESLYRCESGMGISLWEHKPTQTGSEIPTLESENPSADCMVVNSDKDPIVPENEVFTLGIANNLPSGLAVDISITVLDTIEPEETATFTRQFYSEGIPFEITTHVMAGPNREYFVQLQKKLSLAGHCVPLSIPSLKPYSILAVNDLSLPAMGGIMREDEEKKMTYIPKNLGQVMSNKTGDASKLTVAVLRFEFGEKPGQEKQTRQTSATTRPSVPEYTGPGEGVWDSNRQTYLEK